MVRVSFPLLLAVALVLVAVGCDSVTAYDRYAHTPLSGWEKNDTLTFDIPAMTGNGTYHEEVGLRVNGAYPFQQLCVVVEQQLLPRGYRRADTLNMVLQDADGHVHGRGVNYYQYHFPLANMQLNRGDSLHVTIRHNMKREILTGVSDVGFRLSAMKE